ncbi:Protein FAM170A [Manis javanica]|nr:Protein FAM170A [Manis javanica]
MKRKRKRKHLETTRSLKAARMSGGQKATEAAAAASECLSCVPCENKLGGAGVSKLQASGTPPWYLEDETVGPEGNDGPCGSEYYTSGSSLDSASCAEIFKKQKHIGEPGNLPQKELENTSTSDYSSSLSDYENSGITQLPEDVPRVGALEMTPPQNAFLRRPSYVSPPKRLTDMECSSDNNALQGREPAGGAGEPPAQEEGSRAKTPQGLGTLDSGFRCLGCYQVFHSLEVLQAHVENAARERFSCHVFNRAFAQMISKRKKRA